MLSKKKSKQVKQLKYLLLIPILISMLFYISCSEELALNNEANSTKEPFSFYFKTSNGLEKIDMGEKESYIDVFMFYDKYRQVEGFKEITVQDLKPKEEAEYKKISDDLLKRNIKDKVKIEIKLLRNLEDRRAVVAIIPDFHDSPIKSLRKIIEQRRDRTNGKGVSFSVIDKVPTFPGCPENDRNCFNEKIQSHFAENFDADLANQLGLSPGKKRIFMLFEIGESGYVTDIKVRAPSPKLEAEAVRVAQKLPVMISGEHEGKKVAVKYTLPLGIDVK